ncbi:MAG: hypothetical protein KAU21_14745, partial [Gammaproteobacteria bacterium]|nr:hypothetical protein [Gammaproteobacteria bacterium]
MQSSLDSQQENLLTAPEAQQSELQTVIDNELVVTEEAMLEAVDVESNEPPPEPVMAETTISTTDEPQEETYEEQVDVANDELDTSALAKAMYAAQFATAEIIPFHQVVDVQFDINGQADAFYDLIAEAEQQFGPVEPAADVHAEMDFAQHAIDGQVDAFDETYQDLLAQDALAADVGELDAYESLDDPAPTDELSLTEEPSSFLPTTLPEDNETDDSVSVAELHQLEIDQAFIDDADISDEPSADELNLTEQPDANLLTALPEDVPVLNSLNLTEEPYSFLPTSLPVDIESDAASNNVDVSPTQNNKPLMLLPHLSDDTVKQQVLADVTAGKIDKVSERPVIALPDETNKAASQPDFGVLISKADFYTDKMVSRLKDEVRDVPVVDHSQEKIEAKNEPLPLADKPENKISAEVYELKIPPLPPENKLPAPSLGKKYRTPQLDRGSIIIRPDGHVSRSFGLVKLFTIILATSAAGSWWYRDELFYKEQFRKEI